MDTKSFKEEIKSKNHTEIEKMEYDRERYCYSVGLLYSELNILLDRHRDISTNHIMMDLTQSIHSIKMTRKLLVNMYKIACHHIHINLISNGSIGKLIAYAFYHSDLADFDKTTSEDQALILSGAMSALYWD